MPDQEGLSKVAATELAKQAGESSHPDWFLVLYQIARETGESHTDALDLARAAQAEQPKPPLDLDDLAQTLLRSADSSPPPL